MKKILLALLLLASISSYSQYGHLFIQIKKDGLECPLRNGIVLKDSITIHLPKVRVDFEDIKNDSITVKALFQVFQDTTMYITGGKPQYNSDLNSLQTIKYDKDDFTFTNYWISYLREELKTLFGVTNSDITLIKR